MRYYNSMHEGRRDAAALWRRRRRKKYCTGFWFFLVAVSAAVGRFAAHHFPTASAISDSLAILASRLSCALVLIVLKNLLCFSPVRFTSAVNFPLGFFKS